MDRYIRLVLIALSSQPTVLESLDRLQQINDGMLNKVLLDCKWVVCYLSPLLISFLHDAGPLLRPALSETTRSPWD
jgi:hypothetical protein